MLPQGLPQQDRPGRDLLSSPPSGEGGEGSNPRRWRVKNPEKTVGGGSESSTGQVRLHLTSVHFPCLG